MNWAHDLVRIRLNSDRTEHENIVLDFGEIDDLLGENRMFLWPPGLQDENQVLPTTPGVRTDHLQFHT